MKYFIVGLIVGLFLWVFFPVIALIFSGPRDSLRGIQILGEEILSG